MLANSFVLKCKHLWVLNVRWVWVIFTYNVMSLEMRIWESCDVCVCVYTYAILHYLGKYTQELCNRIYPWEGRQGCLEQRKEEIFVPCKRYQTFYNVY